jgi:hypothetical protein
MLIESLTRTRESFAVDSGRRLSVFYRIRMPAFVPTPRKLLERMRARGGNVRVRSTRRVLSTGHGRLYLETSANLQRATAAASRNR